MVQLELLNQDNEKYLLQIYREDTPTNFVEEIEDTIALSKYGRELEQRMTDFLNTDYDAYFFSVDDNVVGYALVKRICAPVYLRQFLIDRQYRKKHYGTEAFHLLLEYLDVKSIDIEVLPWNEAGNRFWESCGFKERLPMVL